MKFYSVEDTNIGEHVAYKTLIEAKKAAKAIDVPRITVYDVSFTGRELLVRLYNRNSFAESVDTLVYDAGEWKHENECTHAAGTPSCSFFCSTCLAQIREPKEP